MGATPIMKGRGKKSWKASREGLYINGGGSVTMDIKAKI